MGPKPVPEEKLVAELKSCVERRERYFQRVQVAFDLIKDLGTASVNSQFLVRCHSLEETFKEFEQYQNRIAELNPLVEEAERIDVLDSSKSFEDLYFKIKAAELDLAPEAPVVVSATSQTPHIDRPKLPNIHISVYDGTYENFASFKSLYDTLVHSHSGLTPIEKFSYLKSLLSGSALAAIQGFPFNEGSYQLAYDTLVQQFSNKRVIANNLCNKLFNLKPFTESNLRQFLDTFNVYVEGLKTVSVPDLADFFLLFMGLKLLDSATRHDFETSRPDQTSVPAYADLLLFIRSRVSVAELIAPSSSKGIPRAIQQPPAASKLVKRSFAATLSRPETRPATTHQCPACDGSHRIVECNKFRALPVSQKYNVLKDKKLCFSCLGPHPRSACQSKYSCRTCDSKSHHTLLHVEKVNQPAVPSTSSTLSCNVIQPSQLQQVLLGTALVDVADVFGQVHQVRILIDSGSMLSLMSQSLFKRLGLPAQRSQLRVSGIGSCDPQPVKGLVTCTLLSRQSSFRLNIDAAVLPTITPSIPALPVSPDVLARLPKANLADPSFFNPSSVDILIGAQYYADVVNTCLPVIHGEPSLVPSMFGYLVMGRADTSVSSLPSQHSFFVTDADSDLNNQIKKFWELEEVVVRIPENPEDKHVEDHFVRTTRREPSGSYVVRLPFRNDVFPDLGDNRAQAEQRWLRMERSLAKNPEFKKLYNENLQEYLDRGHMIPAPNKSPYLLTHHGVLKESSSTTKCRVVFNASEKAGLPMSLNDALLPGPKLQNNIADIVLNFRLNAIALTADVKQMYLSIKLDPRDSPFQQILWRKNPDEPIQQFEIQKVCFGVTSSPFHALRVLKELIVDEKHRFPKAAQVLDTDSYIDDLCTAVSSLSEARQLRSDLTDLLASAGFELRKWACSHPEVLQDLPLDFLEKPHPMGDTETIRVLGLQWDPEKDAFIYVVDSIGECHTKRQILSQIARIYDISGFVSPITVWMKILLQRLWSKGFDWDEPIPADLLSEWNSFVADLPVLKNVKIPRYILSTYVSSPELIGFADASSAAMGACVYLRVVCSDQRVLVHLVRAKSRVAPLKTTTIPRLELCAAYLLSQVIESLAPLKRALGITNVYLFSDSMVFLSWLNTPTHLLKIFVANRIEKILEVTPAYQWRHVPTDKNPADLSSRGCFPSQLISNELWWQGPDFLREHPDRWPLFPTAKLSEIPELKPTNLVATVASNDSKCDQILERFSSYLRAKRVIAWIFRFYNNCRPRDNQLQSGALSVEELDHAEVCMVRITQAAYYSEEIKSIQDNKKLPVIFSRLSPFLLKHCLRVGGRIDKAPIPYDSRHPYILPVKSHLVLLIIRHYHLTSLHGGPKIVQNLIQSKFFIPGLRSTLRKVIFQCVPCYRHSAKPNQPFMAELPLSRFVQGRPWIHVGVDLAGPFTLKDGYRRNAPLMKGYFAIFVCFATKAVHLELLTSLSSNCFLAAFDRFTARRSLPSHVFSDQGTNFKGASRILDETYDFLLKNSSHIQDHLSKQEIHWTFNAPANPSAGGLWEAGVKSVKHHLKRILSDRSLHVEEFGTILCRIEAILNSRPLGVPPNQPPDTIDCLTPGHFITGAALLCRPERDLTNINPGRLPRWDFLTQVCQNFWSRWRSEYLHTLIQRQKCLDHPANVKVGDVVVLVNEQEPPLKWSLGKITKLLPASDGVVRIVNVKTSSGSLTRPIRKLLILPFCQ